MRDTSAIPLPNLIGMKSVVSCPLCQHSKAEIIPSNFCLFFYECEGCHTVLRPKPGDCCVFCSYGSAPCTFKCR
jgi:hypothetical protein